MFANRRPFQLSVPPTNKYSARNSKRTLWSDLHAAGTRFTLVLMLLCYNMHIPIALNVN